MLISRAVVNFSAQSCDSCVRGARRQIISFSLSRAMCARSAIHPTPASQHKASPLFSVAAAAATAAIATVLIYSCSARCYHAKIQLTEIRLANKRPVQMWAIGVEYQHLDPYGGSQDWIYLPSTAWLALMWRKCCIFIFISGERRANVNGFLFYKISLLHQGWYRHCSPLDENFLSRSVFEIFWERISGVGVVPQQELLFLAFMLIPRLQVWFFNIIRHRELWSTEKYLITTLSAGINSVNIALVLILHTKLYFFPSSRESVAGRMIEEQHEALPDYDDPRLISSSLAAFVFSSRAGAFVQGFSWCFCGQQEKKWQIYFTRPADF